MKFKAHIKLTEEQSQDAVRYGAEDTEYADVEFTLFDLAYCSVGTEAPYSFRELLIPWLIAGNQPEIVDCEPENIKTYMSRHLEGGLGIWGFTREFTSNFIPYLEKEKRYE